MPKNKGKRDSEISFAYLNKEILILSNFFNFCIKKNCLEKNPCAGLKKLNELSRLKTLSDEDIKKLIAGATNKLTRDIIIFLIYTACKNAGLKDLRIHDLRHVFASKMVMNGTSLYITGELLGHRTTQMTKRYSHLVPDTLRKAVNEVWSKEK